MEFGVSTWLWTSPFNNETISLFPMIKEMGFGYVEIPIEDPSLIDAVEVKKGLDDHELKPIVCGAFGPSRDLTHEDAQVHRTCFDYIFRCFGICHELGASFVAGPMYSAVGKARLLPPDKRRSEWNRAVHNLRLVCERAERESLDIALEPLNRFETDLVNTCADVVRLIGDINHPNAKILLDSFHMCLEERNLEEAITLAGDKLIHMQVSENYRGIPGTGQTNWTAIHKGLQTINYTGILSIESFTPHVQELADAVCIWKSFADNQNDFAREGLDFLKSIFLTNK